MPPTPFLSGDAEEKSRKQREMDFSAHHILFRKLLKIIQEELFLARVKLILVKGSREVVCSLEEDIREEEKADIRPEILTRLVEEKQPLILNSAIPSLNHSGTGGEKRRLLYLPLLINQMLTGILSLQRSGNLRPFLEEDLRLAIALSEPILWTLKNRVVSGDSEEQGSETAEPFFGGQSKAARSILALIDRVKDCDVPVFISGESGTGKELVARAIHNRGIRRHGKFVATNCGAIPESLLESELFGYVKGAFTGAVRDKPGLVEEANDGTFFLDEVGDMSPHVQAKLLRLLQEKEIRRIGENQTQSVSSRFISATNRNIEKEVERGRFRQDLYYRLKIFTIDIPPLRERKEDILFLLDNFLERYCREMKRRRVHFSPQSLELILDYQWPGNVRELQNEVQRCLVLAGESRLIETEHLSVRINPHREKPASLFPDFFQARAAFEKRFIQQALARSNFNKVRTARELGLSRQGLFKLMKRRGIALGAPEQAEFSA